MFFLTLINIYINQSRNGKRMAKVSCYCLGHEVARGAQGAFPGSMWDGSKGWEKEVQMPSCVTLSQRSM